MIRKLAALWVAFALACASSCGAPAYAQAIKITQLPALTVGAPGDLVPCVHGGVTLGCTDAQLDVYGGSAMLSGAAFTGPVQVGGHGAIVKLVGTDGLHAAPGTYLADQAMFASCPNQAGVGVGGCGGPLDVVVNNEKKQWLFQGVSNLGATPEWSWTLDESINTGYAAPWYYSTPYATGALVEVNGNIYTATVGGTSAASGSGPSGTGASIVDGTVAWAYSCGLSAGCNSKLAFNVTSTFGANAGRSWAVSINAIMAPGFNHSLPAGGFANAAELDFSNNSGSDCAFVPGSYADHCYGLWFFGGGTYQSTAAVVIDSNNNPTTSAYRYAVWFPYGYAKTCGVACIEMDAPGPLGLEFGGDNYGTRHSTATIRDNSSARDSYQASGLYDYAVFDATVAQPQAGATAPLMALAMRPNQTVCFTINLGCFYYDANSGVGGAIGDNKLHWSGTGGSSVWNLDNAGNETASGTVTANAMTVAGSTANGLTINGGHGNAGYYDASTSLLAAQFSGTYSGSILDMRFATLTGGANGQAILLAANQKVCFTGTLGCFRYNNSSNKLIYSGTLGNDVLSVDNGGNVRALGTITASVTP